MPDGHHHGCGGCVANPHGEEGCDQHEAQKQPTGKQTDTPPFRLPSRHGMPVYFSTLDPTQTHRAGRTPMMRSTRRAMRLCSFQCSTDTATIIPPMNNMLVSLKYSMPTWGVGMDLRLWCLLPILLGTGHDILTNWYPSGTSEPNGNGLWAISHSTGARLLPNSLLFLSLRD